MKYIKISLFLGIIIFSGFFAKTTLATVCGFDCDEAKTNEGRSCETIDLDKPQDQAEIVQILSEMECLSDKVGACEDPCPVGDPGGPRGCTCVFEFSGENCNVDEKKVFLFGGSPYIRDVINQLDFKNCPKNAFNSDFIDINHVINVSADNCNNVDEKMVSLSGYRGLLYCRDNSETVNFVPGSGLPASIKTWSDLGVANIDKTSDTGTKPQTVSLVNPLGTTNLIEIFGKLIKAFVGLVGMIVLVVFVYGGFMWLLSAGNPEKIKKGTQAMMYALIGLFIIFSAYVIISTILKALI